MFCLFGWFYCAWSHSRKSMGSPECDQTRGSPTKTPEEVRCFKTGHDHEKINTIKDWFTHTSIEEVRSFLELTSYYWQFLQDSERTAFPLHLLTEKDRKLALAAECQNGFEELRNRLTEAPVQKFSDFTETVGLFILDTDAGETVIGAVIPQLGSE